MVGCLGLGPVVVIGSNNERLAPKHWDLAKEWTAMGNPDRCRLRGEIQQVKGIRRVGCLLQTVIDDSWNLTS